MSYQKLKEQIKSGDFSPAYHFFGPEQYLKHYYLHLLQSTIVDEAFSAFNLTVFEGNADANAVSTAAETPPMMAEKRLIILKETGLFSPAAAGKAIWQRLFTDWPSYACLVAVEDTFDKRSAVYKAFSSICLPVEFAYRPRGDLKAWVTKKLGKSGKTMSRVTLENFLDAAGVEMYGIDAHLEKLIAYVGQREEITDEDVNQLLVRSIMTKEYVLTDALFAKKSSEAYAALQDLRMLRTDPIRILTVIASNYLSVMRARALLDSGQPAAAVATALKLPSAFLAKKMVETARKQNADSLSNAIHQIRETDYKIKIGLVTPEAGITSLCAALLM
ncbi:MAG: DNA polymerase III subunit delta [Clostridia bacterium]|nr:DNA polymerase III subunit delta [Clostridia bacterium]